MKQSGFTLIELLVVVSIISLLSSIILGSLNIARLKVENSRRNSLILQYRNALELARSKSGDYPGSVNVCLGDYPLIGAWSNEVCGAYTSGKYPISESNPNLAGTLAFALKEFLPSLPAVSLIPVVGTDGSKFLGATYCYDAASSCPQAQIAWWLTGDTGCVLGATKSTSNQVTTCNLTLN